MANVRTGNNEQDTASVASMATEATYKQAPTSGKLEQILASQSLVGAITEDLRKFLETLKKYFEANSHRYEIDVPTIEMLPAPRSTFAVILNKKAYLVRIMDQVYGGMDTNRAESDRFNEAKTHLRNLGVTNVIGYEMVEKEVLNSVDRLGKQVLVQHALIASNNAALTISLYAGIEVVYVEDHERARAMARDLSPKTVLPRSDIGFMWGIRKKTNKTSYYGENGLRLQEDLEDGVQWVAATLGYTRISPVDVGNNFYGGNNIRKFSPKALISNVYPALAVPGVISNSIAIAQELWVNRRGWIAAFLNFDAASTRGRNLGRLVPQQDDPTKPAFLPDPNYMGQWIDGNMLPAVLGVAITDGLDQPAGLNVFDTCRTGSRNPEAGKDIAAFLSRDTGKKNLPMDIDMFYLGSEYVGYLGDSSTGGIQVDSREFDNLKLTELSNKIDPTIQALGDFYPDARLQYDMQKAAGVEFTPLYRSRNYLFTGPILDIILDAARSLDWIGVGGNRTNAGAIRSDSAVLNIINSQSNGTRTLGAVGGLNRGPEFRGVLTGNL
jgi:hypothetical protein